MHKRIDRGRGRQLEKAIGAEVVQVSVSYWSRPTDLVL